MKNQGKTEEKGHENHVKEDIRKKSKLNKGKAKWEKLCEEKAKKKKGIWARKWERTEDEMTAHLNNANGIKSVNKRILYVLKPGKYTN